MAYSTTTILHLIAQAGRGSLASLRQALTDINSMITSLSTTELGYIDGVVAGTVTALKAVVVDTNKHIDTLAIAASGLKIGTSGSETAVTATGAELNALAGATVTNATLNKAAILSTGGAITFPGPLTLGATAVTATEFAALAGATVTNATLGKAAILSTAGAITIPGPLTLGATVVTTSEFAVLAGAGVTNATLGKAAILSTGGAITIPGPLTLGATVVTTSEFAALAGATVTNATLGKAAILSTAGAITLPGPITVGTTAISEAEIAVLDGVSVGVVASSKAVVAGTSKQVDYLDITSATIGASATDGVGFWAAAKTSQRANAAQVAVTSSAGWLISVTNTSGVLLYGFDTTAHAVALFDLITEMRSVLTQTGLMKGAA